MVEVDVCARRHRDAGAGTVVDPRSSVDAVVEAVFHGGLVHPLRLKCKAIDVRGPVPHERRGTSEAIVSERSATGWPRCAGSDVVVERDGVEGRHGG
ncbi:MAG: hypothetical protein HOV94_15595 [Saccharothrix sp.]|nr:hypothetical protein [Saccharothrix sp.]